MHLSIMMTLAYFFYRVLCGIERVCWTYAWSFFFFSPYTRSLRVTQLLVSYVLFSCSSSPPSSALTSHPRPSGVLPLLSHQFRLSRSSLCYARVPLLLPSWVVSSVNCFVGRLFLSHLLMCRVSVLILEREKSEENSARISGNLLHCLTEKSRIGTC